MAVYIATLNLGGNISCECSTSGLNPLKVVHWVARLIAFEVKVFLGEYGALS